MLVLKRLIAFVVTGVTVIGAGGVAWAGLGQPSPWELGLQQSASPVMDDIVWFHNFLLWLTAAIAVFVLVLEVFLAWSYRSAYAPLFETKRAPDAAAADRAQREPAIA